MAPRKGDKVLIVAGPNTGKTGTFVANTGMLSCYVILAGNSEKQMFRRGSVQVMPNQRDTSPTPNDTRNHNHTDFDRDAAVLALINKMNLLKVDVANVERDLEKLLSQRRADS